MQSEYIPLVNELENECRLHFADRLVSAYVHGSIDKQDAVYGVSDLDYYIVVAEDIKTEDLKWREEIKTQLQQRFDIVDEVHLTMRSVEALKDDPYTRFILSYNATLRMGQAIECIPVYQNCECYSPSKEVAKMRLSFAMQCFAEALQQKQPQCTGKLPSDTYYAARKLARYFIIVEGAYFLMTRNRFCGFDKDYVLTALRECATGFHDALNMASAVLSDPLRAQIDQETFIKKAQPLVEWMFCEIQKA